MNYMALAFLFWLLEMKLTGTLRSIFPMSTEWRPWNFRTAPFIASAVIGVTCEVGTFYCLFKAL